MARSSFGAAIFLGIVAALVGAWASNDQVRGQAMFALNAGLLGAILGAIIGGVVDVAEAIQRQQPPGVTQQRDQRTP
jgi:uncharacterized membrane protein YeaQ/YmgE (transglycosylase-associated protein family)